MARKTVDVPGRPEIDPSNAATPAQYVALLRQWRLLSGMSYRQLQRLARSQGEDLPPSTLGTMLSRETLPREQFVTTLLRAGGADDAELAQWLDAHRRLRLGVETPQAPVAGRATSRKPWWVLAGTVAVVLVAASLWIFRTPHKPRHVAGPELGPVAIQPAGSDLCLSERPDQEDGFLYEAECASALPKLTLVRDGDTYGIATMHPRFGAGCMGYNPYYRQLRPSDGYCDEMRAKGLTLEPADGGYRIRFADIDRCMAVRDGPHRTGADIVVAECDAHSSRQVFTFRTPPEGESD